MIDPTVDTEIGENRPARADKGGADRVGARDGGDQHRKAQRPGDCHPVGRDEGQERCRDQQAAEDPDRDRHMRACGNRG